jgi:hypothetical protein
VSRVALLMNPTNPNVDVERMDTEAGARKLGLETIALNARNAREIDSAFEQLLDAKADGIVTATGTAAFVAHLRELGWIENRNVAIEYRWSEGRTERYAEIAAEFVWMKVDVIVTVGSAVPTVRQATSVIPIVFAVAIDPVGSGLVASLAKPGGNVTALSLQAANLACLDPFGRADRSLDRELDRPLADCCRSVHSCAAVYGNIRRCAQPRELRTLRREEKNEGDTDGDIDRVGRIARSLSQRSIRTSQIPSHRSAGGHRGVRRA